jgi:hypothetical protein
MFANRLRYALLVLLAIGIGGLAAAPKGRKKPVEVPFTVLLDGHYSWIDYPLEQVVRDQDAWESLWSLHADSPTCGFTSPPPAVDFDHEIVVAVFMGMCANERFSVRIDRVIATAEGGYLVEYVEEEIQAKGMMFNDMMATPFVFAVVPRTDGAVTFSGTEVIVKRRK